MDANLIQVVRICDQVLASNPEARICVIGSQSAHRGSFDEVYALAKCALHQYVRTKALRFRQQLVCIAPSIIRDSGMTERRHDYADIMGETLLSAREVAELARFLLYDAPSISNTVVEIGAALR